MFVVKLVVYLAVVSRYICFNRLYYFPYQKEDFVIYLVRQSRP